jgi:hypothetical protein
VGLCVASKASFLRYVFVVYIQLNMPGLMVILENLKVSVPLRQQIAVGSYLIKQKIKGVKKYPLVLMLEPLFKCNLACAGCGKIDYPDDILDKRLSVEECLAAVDECGAPMVSIPVVSL